MALCETGYDLAMTRTLFLRICALCYAMAFLSLYPQIPGLYGPHGLLPVHGMLDASSALSSDGKSFDYSKLTDLMKGRPTFLWLHGIFGLSPDLMMDVICLAGTFLGVLAAMLPKWSNKLTFVLLWTFYQSVYQVRVLLRVRVSFHTFEVFNFHFRDNPEK